MFNVNPRTALAFAHDIVAAVIAWTGAFWLRFNLDIPQPYLNELLESLLWAIPLQAVVFWRFGLYRGIWRYASMPDLKRILLAVGITALAIPAGVVMLHLSVPRSVLVLDPVLLVIMMGGSRLAYRVWKERTLRSFTDGQREPVVVIGADEAAVGLLKELARSAQWRVAAVLDDDAGKIGRQLQGVPVLAALSELPRHLDRLGVHYAIIAMPAATHTAGDARSTSAVKPVSRS